MRWHPILFALAIVALPLAAGAQKSDADTVDLGVLLRKERSYNITLHTLGYGLGYRVAKSNDYFSSTGWEFDFLEMKAPNQHKTYNQFIDNPRNYVYGKLNNLYLLRAGYGRQKVISHKPYWGGLELRWILVGGLEAGIAKPVYLYIAYYNFDSTLNATFYNLQLEKYDPEKHFTYRGQNPNADCDIAGRGPLLKGLNELKIYPGAFAKIGINFEYSDYNEKIKALEIGLAVDVLPQGVPVMAFDPAYTYFVTAYLGYHWGRKAY